MRNNKETILYKVDGVQRDKFLLFLTSFGNLFINLIEMHVNYCNFMLNYLLTEILVDYYSDA